MVNIQIYIGKGWEWWSACRFL